MNVKLHHNRNGIRFAQFVYSRGMAFSSHELTYAKSNFSLNCRGEEFEFE